MNRKATAEGTSAAKSQRETLIASRQIAQTIIGNLQSLNILPRVSWTGTRRDVFARSSEANGHTYTIRTRRLRFDWDFRDHTHLEATVEISNVSLSEGAEYGPWKPEKVIVDGDGVHLELIGERSIRSFLELLDGKTFCSFRPFRTKLFLASDSSC